MYVCTPVCNVIYLDEKRLRRKPQSAMELYRSPADFGARCQARACWGTLPHCGHLKGSW